MVDNGNLKSISQQLINQNKEGQLQTSTSISNQQIQDLKSIMANPSGFGVRGIMDSANNIRGINPNNHSQSGFLTEAITKRDFRIDSDKLPK